MKPPQSLSENIIYLISETHKQAADEVNRIFREKGFKVSVEQFAVLAVLWYQNGANQKYIAEQINRDKTTVSRTVATMIRSGLLMKAPDPNDGRGTLIYLTPQGTEIQQALVEATGAFYQQALKDISEEDHQIALRVLQKIRQNIS